jgi:hypothetical protein
MKLAWMRRLGATAAVAGMVGLGCSEDAAKTASVPDAGVTPDASTLPDVTPVEDPDAGDTADAGPLDAADGTNPDAGTAFVEPTLLSETGLYLDDMRTLAPGVREYTPQFELWSDGAEKRRFVALPEGASINSSNMDFWKYPVGTKLWKEFTRDGVRVETRLLQKTKNQWFMVAFQWNAEGTDATAVPLGVANASGTEHDIPRTEDCRTCHNHMPDKVLGFAAVQLAHDRPGVTLDTLVTENVLTEPPEGSLALPGDATARAALGYLHGNCGGCHSDRSQVPAVDLRLYLTAATLGSLQDTPTYKTTVGETTGAKPVPETPSILVAPGNPEESALLFRMQSRTDMVEMPPLASEQVDTVGTNTVAEWIRSLQE